MKPFNYALLILGIPMLTMVILILIIPQQNTEKHLRITSVSGQTYEVDGRIDYSSGQIQFRDRNTHSIVQIMGTFSVE